MTQPEVILKESPDFLRHFTDKDAIASYVAFLTNQVKNGAVPPLQLHCHIIALEKALEQVKKNVKDNVLNEAGKYAGEGRKFNAYGAEIELSDVGVKIDYSACNDEEWNTASKKEENAANTRKEREKFLRVLKEPIANAETGEIINPPVRTATEGIKVSFK